jgi:hypothetical protein
LIPFVLINLKEDFKFSLGILTALAVPFLGLFPWIFNLILPTAKRVLTPAISSWSVALPDIIPTLGYLPIGLCIFGAIVLVKQGTKRDIGLLLGLFLILCMLNLFFTFHFGVNILYQRGITFAILVMAIVAGAGLWGIRTIRLNKNADTIKLSYVKSQAGVLIFFGLVVAILVSAVPSRLDTDYYHMIDYDDYQAFAWISDNVSPNYKNAVLDPWKATAFTAVSGKTVYTRMHSRLSNTDQEAYDFLRNDCADTDFLRNNSISVVYSLDPVSNENLTEIRKGVYLFQK